ASTTASSPTRRGWASCSRSAAPPLPPPWPPPVRATRSPRGCALARCGGGARRLGLVSQGGPDDELDDVVFDLAQSIAARPPLVVRFAREHVQPLAARDGRGTRGRGRGGQAMVLASYDYREHRQARAEDREPRYERR